MTVAFIPAIGHQKRTTTQKVIPIFRWGDRLIRRHCLVLVDSQFSSESGKAKRSYNFPAQRHVGAQNVTKSYKPFWTQSHDEIGMKDNNREACFTILLHS